ncbi:hypothetical protein NKI38_04585 [Mesorhizobium sp. M0621]|uniref:hypothetical protein n=1 Tax=Mesorhizobium sp. M0621 TaxID=2956974 RepID=UPI0033357912
MTITKDMDDSMSDKGCFSLVNFHQRDLLVDMTNEEFKLLQDGHDNSFDPDQMKEKFYAIALELDLHTPATP